MRLRVLKSFKDKLNDQIEYIARDKPEAARRFKKEVLQRIREIPQMPYSNRKSSDLPGLNRIPSKVISDLIKPIFKHDEIWNKKNTPGDPPTEGTTRVL